MTRSNQSNTISKVREWLLGALIEKVPAEQQLQRDAASMMDELDKLAELTSFAMARADEKYEALQNEVARHEALDTQSGEFLNEGDEEAARRCVALGLESAAKIQKLQDEYSALQHEAESKAQQFLDRKNAIAERVAQIPQLQDDARIVRMQEEMDKSFSSLSLESAQNSFDATARGLEAKKRQMANRAALLEDPNAALDRRISQDSKEREIDRAMDALRAKLGNAPIIDVELVDDVNDAKQLLQAPRYKGILPGASVSRSTASRGNVGRKARNE